MRGTNMIVAKAPAKVILFGEHAVVYGYPSIASALDLYVKVNISKRKENGLVVKSNQYNIIWDNPKKVPEPFKPLRRIIDLISKDYDVNIYAKNVYVEINSDLPPGCGLGTSAACSVAFTAALLEHLDFQYEKEKINYYAFEGEKVSHGTPSGIDNTISTYGGLLLYVKKDKPVIQSLENPPNLVFVLIDTGIPRNTKQAVLSVAKLFKKHSIIGSVMDVIGDIVNTAWTEFQKGENADVQTIGELMNINHGLLSALGVSSAKIEEIVYLLRKKGVYGAKLTGAGIGGYVLGLLRKEITDRLEKTLRTHGYKYFISRINRKGISIEHIR